MKSVCLTAALHSIDLEFVGDLCVEFHCGNEQLVVAVEWLGVELQQEKWQSPTDLQPIRKHSQQSPLLLRARVHIIQSERAHEVVSSSYDLAGVLPMRAGIVEYET